MAGFIEELAIAYNGAFKKQTTFGTPLANNLLDTRVKAASKGPTQFFVRRKQSLDCTSQFVESEDTISVYAAQSFTIEVTPQVLGGWLYMFFGVDTSTGTDPIAHDLKLITGRNVPVTTLRIGHAEGDDADVGWVYPDCACTSARVYAATGQDQTVMLDVNLVMSANRVAGPNSTWPACYQGNPVLLSEGDFTIDSGSGAVSYLSLLRTIDCQFSNNIATSDDPFFGNSIHVQRWRRTALRGYGNSFLLEGIDSPGNAIATLINANSFIGTSGSAIWSIGPAGNRVQILYPKINFRAQDGSIQGYYGELNSGVLQSTVQPLRDTAVTSSPVHAIATIPAAQQAAAYGVAA